MIPDLYHNIFSQKLLGLSIQEFTADCSNCVMAKKTKPFTEKAHYRDEKSVYKPDLKCCTFHPFFPNYIVGAILQDARAQNKVGRKVMQERIVNKKELLPLGVPAPRNYQIRFLQHEHQFGTKQLLLCPFFDQGKNQCGFWLYRGSVCTSFFCASDHSKGLAFWDELRKYHSLLEMTLAELVLEQMGLDAREAMAGFDLIDLKEVKPAKRKVQSANDLKRMRKNLFWQDFGSPEAFYIECYKQVQKISRVRLQKNLGQLLQDQEKRVFANYRMETQSL